MKNLLLSLLIALLFTTTVSAENVQLNKSKYDNYNYCGNNSLTNGLESNQTTLFYMYSNENGHYFLDPLAEYENVIYIDLDELFIDIDSMHHGKRYIGTFTDNTLWELVDIKEAAHAVLEVE